MSVQRQVPFNRIIGRRITIRDLQQAKIDAEKWVMLTSYEEMTASIFDEAGVPVLLVGDSAGNNFLGQENTIPVTVDEMIPLVRAVVRGSSHAMVVADLPFGSYESSPEQALATSIRFFKESGAQAVKLEGSHPEQIRKLVGAGIPVMGHLGLTPQSIHLLSGYRITQALTIPTIGIGAGSHCDAQVLVWTDLMGLTKKPPRFAKQYLNLRQQMQDATTHWVQDVASGAFPAQEHTFH
jgi:3-methyl-2-oxobutanoate hydroxymethyltransferase